MTQTTLRNADLPAVNGKVALFGVALIAAIVIASFAVLIVNSADAAAARSAPTTAPTR